MERVDVSLFGISSVQSESTRSEQGEWGKLKSWLLCSSAALHRGH